MLVFVVQKCSEIPAKTAPHHVQWKQMSRLKSLPRFLKHPVWDITMATHKPGVSPSKEESKMPRRWDISPLTECGKTQLSFHIQKDYQDAFASIIFIIFQISFISYIKIEIRHLCVGILTVYIKNRWQNKRSIYNYFTKHIILLWTVAATQHLHISTATRARLTVSALNHLPDWRFTTNKLGGWFGRLFRNKSNYSQRFIETPSWNTKQRERPQPCIQLQT